MHQTYRGNDLGRGTLDISHRRPKALLDLPEHRVDTVAQLIDGHALPLERLVGSAGGGLGCGRESRELVRKLC
jgi:hypothetical protein